MAESEIERPSPDTVGETDDGAREFPLLVQASASYQGPLPPADELAKYEETLPGLAQIIVDMAQKEQAFRHDMSRSEQKTVDQVVHHADAKTRLGQIGAFVIAMTTIGGSIWLIDNGHSVGGITGIVGALVALSTVFVIGKRYESAEESESDIAGSE